MTSFPFRKISKWADSKNILFTALTIEYRTFKLTDKCLKTKISFKFFKVNRNYNLIKIFTFALSCSFTPDQTITVYANPSGNDFIKKILF